MSPPFTLVADRQNTTECLNAVPLSRTFRSAGLFAAVPQSLKNSSNGKDHMAGKTNNTQY